MTSSISMMDITAKIKKTITVIQNTKTKPNLQFANKLEKCLLLYNASKAKSTKVRKEDISISSNFDALHIQNDGHDQKAKAKFEDLLMVKILDQDPVPSNLEEFNNRDDGFEYWEEFEDQRDYAPSNIESIISRHDSLEQSPALLEDKQNTVYNLTTEPQLNEELPNKTCIDEVTKTILVNKILSNTKTAVDCCEQNRYMAPSNLEAFNSRDNSLDVWTDFVDREIMLKGEIVEKKETGFGEVDKLPNNKCSNKENTFFLANHEEFNHRDSGLEQWAEFDDEDKAYNVVLDRSKVKSEHFIKDDVKEVFEDSFDKSTALKTSNENVYCDKSVEYHDESKKVQEVENEHSGKTETSTGDDKQKTITVKVEENTFPCSRIEVLNRTYDGLDQLEEKTVYFVEEGNQTVLEEYSTSTIDHRNNLLKCKFCPLLIKDGNHKNGELRNHMRKAHFVCCICEYKSNNKMEAETHFANQHEEENGYLRCNIGECQFRENRTARLKQIVHKERQLYTMGSGMRTHIRSVHQDIWFKCDQCPIKKRVARDLKEHQQTHAILQETRTRKECTICGIRLLGTRGGNLSRHMKLIHGDQPSLFCSKCKFSTKDKHYLKTHEQGHTELIRCIMCEFSCVQANYMKRHIQFKHEGEAYLCSSCDFKADTLSHLRDHEEQHNERTLKCPHCNYMGRGDITLKKHMLRHEDPKYLCTECDYKTYDGGNFSTHRTTKHGKVVHKCESCDYGTKSKRSLRQHKDKHHKL